MELTLKERKFTEMDKALDLTNFIKMRIALLQDEIKKRTNYLSNAPAGSVRCYADGEQFRYYQKLDKSDHCGRYINAANVELARNLAQKEYDERFILTAQEEITCLKSFAKKYSNCRVNDIFEKLHAGKRKLITPFCLCDEDFVKNWLAVGYEPGFFPHDFQPYYTNKGLKVHSKSEVIIAESLDYYQIPYRYEFPIIIDGEQVRPDFYCLNKRKRKELIWEHFGMMDNIGYANHNVDKLNAYNRNGFYPGINMIITMETSKNQLDTRQIHQVIRNYLLS